MHPAVKEAKLVEAIVNLIRQNIDGAINLSNEMPGLGEGAVGVVL